MLELIKALYPLELGPVAPDMMECRINIHVALEEATNAQVYTYNSGMEHNGWIVPNSWEPDTVASIYVPAQYALPVPSDCEGMELTPESGHIFRHRNNIEATPYHCDWYYKPHLRDWGIVANWPGTPTVPDWPMYVVNEAPGTMEVLRYVLPGTVGDETYVLQAHNCHPHQANDDLSGIAVGVETMKRLARKPRRNNYELIICPEHFGMVMYLAHHRWAGRPTGVIYLDAVGAGGALKWQQSFWGGSTLDQAARMLGLPQHGFREFIGNDETIWEAPGVNVPCASLTRAPYPEYHMLNFDTPGIINPLYLDETVHYLESLVGLLEDRHTLRNKHGGLVCLSNPKYGLYRTPGSDPTYPAAESGKRVADEYRLMTDLPMMIEQGWGVEAIAREHSMATGTVQDYIAEWRKVGLIQ
jgi:aminopeptidase-like protein